jgi:hypothetical protein
VKVVKRAKEVHSHQQPESIKKKIAANTFEFQRNYNRKDYFPALGK